MTYISYGTENVSVYEPVTTSGDVSFSGLGNGTDFSEIVDAQVEAESYRKQQYEAQLEEQEYVVDMLEQLADEFDALESILEDFDTVSEFLEYSVSSTDDAVSVSADPGAELTPGSHTLEVGRVARNDVWMNTADTFEGTDDVVAVEATTLRLSYAGEEIEVDVHAGATAAELVELINSASGGSVEASLLYDGEAYLLTLAGTDTGAANVVTVEDAGTLTFAAGGFENTQQACDAWVRVDGYPTDPDDWISRPGNDIDDLIPGLSLTVSDVTDGAVRVSAEYDEEAMLETVETFVESVNQIILDIQTVTGRVPSYVENESGEEEQAPAVKSYALDLIYSELKSILASSVTGGSEGDSYTVLSQIGLSTDADEDSETFGQLLLDTDELEAALAEDARSVAELFSASGETTCADGQVAFVSLVEGITAAGDHDIAYVVEDGVLVSATIDGQPALVDGWNIEGAAGTQAQGLLVTVQDQAEGAHHTSVSVKQGKVGQLMEALESWTESETGTLTILVEYCRENIDSLEEQIYDEEVRLAAYEDSLTRKYANLDGVLAEYAEMGETLEVLIGQLG